MSELQQSLKIKFNQLAHQESAIDSIAEVFADAYFDSPDEIYHNPLLNKKFSEQQIMGTIKKLKKRNKITQAEVHYDNTEPLNIDILMETGTGKTFTFIETMYRLHSQHKLAKFILLVPSIAIKKGAVKNIEITKSFFSNKYPEINIAVFDYSPKNINSFVHNPHNIISVLIMTDQAFNKDTNIINKKNLEEGGSSKARSRMQQLAELNPVIIIDEPHKFTGKKTLASIPNFNPQIIFRFGATFRDGYKNLIYVLDSVDAFKQKLVKSITVHGRLSTSKDDFILRYKEGSVKKQKATIEFQQGDKNPRQVEVGVGDSLGEKMEIDFLNGHIIEKVTSKEILFSSQESLTRNASIDLSGGDADKQRRMLEDTIQIHFDKEERLFKQNIKALSLIFIDGVKKYLDEDSKKNGILAKDFEAIYKTKLKEKLQDSKLDSDYRKYLKRTENDISKVHHGYFAVSRRDKDMEGAINLILEEKEKLLSTQSDLRFIFSMWALQEGWDNPNVFTICKLAPSVSGITKLQQIGRGLRLAVRQTPSGYERVTTEAFSPNVFKEINLLSVIVPEEEHSFVKDIQGEVSANSMHNVTNIIRLQHLIDIGVCGSISYANDILRIAHKNGLVDYDRESDTAEILSMALDKLEITIEELHAEDIKFDEEKLRLFFTEYEDLNRSISSSSSAETDPDIKINRKKWKRFKILWQDINHHSVYKFDINQKNLMKKIVKSINDNFNIGKSEFINITTERAEFADTAKTIMKPRKPRGNYSYYSFYEFIRKIADETKLSLASITKILYSIKPEKFEMIANNEVRAVQRISDICVQEINREIVDSLKFEFYEPKKNTKLTKNNKVHGTIKRSEMGKELYRIEDKTAADKSLTDKDIAYDSSIERDLIESSNLPEIDVFAKIPEIRIPIPGGRNYNPDFAYVIKKGKNEKGLEEYHLVIETKKYTDEQSLRGIEQFKTDVAKIYFEALYQHTKKNSEIPIGYEIMWDQDKNKVISLSNLLSSFENRILNQQN